MSAGHETLTARAAELIAEGLTGGGFVKPGATPEDSVAIPAFRTTGMSDDMAKTVHATALILAEGIVNRLTTAGLALIEQAELDDMRTIHKLHAGERPPTIAICCPHGNPIVEVATADRVKLAPPQMTALGLTCQHE